MSFRRRRIRHGKSRSGLGKEKRWRCGRMQPREGWRVRWAMRRGRWRRRGGEDGEEGESGEGEEGPTEVTRLASPNTHARHLPDPSASCCVMPVAGGSRQATSRSTGAVGAGELGGN